jgi:ribosomal protein L37AE/L43A
MLDYNYRSFCCKAPIRLGKKTVKKREIKVWVCVKCGKRDIAIIPKDSLQSQPEIASNFEIPDLEDE